MSIIFSEEYIVVHRNEEHLKESSYIVQLNQILHAIIIQRYMVHCCA
jgi:hypothetical protein